MNTNRLYLVDVTDPSNPKQIEVSRSAPNTIQPTTEWEVPVEYNVSRVKVVQGYGNIDTYIYAVKDIDMTEYAGELAVEPRQVPAAPAVATHKAKVQVL